MVKKNWWLSEVKQRIKGQSAIVSSFKSKLIKDFIKFRENFPTLRLLETLNPNKKTKQNCFTYNFYESEVDLVDRFQARNWWGIKVFEEIL